MIRKIAIATMAMALVSVAPAQLLFSNGLSDQNNGNEMTQWLQAENFSAASNSSVESARFWSGDLSPSTWDGSLTWWIFNDSGGAPGSVVATGAATNIVRTATGNTVFGSYTEYEWTFDLTPTAVTGSVTYWFGLHASTDFNRDEIYWMTSSNGVGPAGHESDGGTLNNWSSNGSEHAFELYGAVPEPSTFVALAGLAGLLAIRRKRRA